MKRHPFDSTAFVLGLALTALGLFFLTGDRTAADIGWRWMWPLPIIVLGLLFVISAGRRMAPRRDRRGEPNDGATITEEMPIQE